METTRSIIVPRRKVSPALLANFAAIAAAFLLLNDSYVLSDVLVSPSEQTGTLAYLLVGSWLVTVVILVSNHFGKVPGEYVETPRLTWKFQLLALGSGIAGMVGTYAYMSMLDKYNDPAPIIVLGPLVMIYTAAYENRSAKLPILRNLLSVLLVAGGVFLSVIEKDQTGTLNFTGEILLIILFVSNVAFAADRIWATMGTKTHGAGSMLFWRFIWFALSASVYVFAKTWLSGTTNALFSLIGEKFFQLLPWLVLTVVLITVEGKLRLNAQALGGLTEAGTYGALQIFYAIPLTWVVLQVFPNAPFTIPSDGIIWFWRFFGALLVVAGALNSTFLRKSVQQQQND